MSHQFNELLTRQLGNEFAASQQYIAIAAWFDGQDLPRLAKHFYRQALEERNHAMMMVQYMLDRGIKFVIPGIGEVRNDFATAEDPLVLALAQEIEVTEQIKELFAAARAENDPLGEQFMLWFLKEQVEEVASMSTLLNIARRASSLFEIETFLARESVGDAGQPGADGGAGAPEAAGGTL
ncbi:MULTISPECIES: ferritin [Paeniglutamicibacter]|jgi:ferritin|uniref:Ferritin n=1 Tax=Paeniglutamicibacter sulfureus TaxID=43666 RepID=A0ABU2BFL0_9MICC|nr:MULTISPECIES: ferritin [Paeniglutamicibacter]MCV9992843.1 ferritin [Paeniglutamicibacter sp. ZC-3]MDO2933127.1 ferritin [Paeniglutamicibacter sulfureus]MDR7357425.1 ferritin [Paeniglutamicibacter sulfureus]